MQNTILEHVNVTYPTTVSILLEEEAVSSSYIWVFSIFLRISNFVSVWMI